MAKRRSSKAPNGEGSVYRTKDGRWKVAVTVGKTAAGITRRRTRIFDKRADAEAYRREMLGMRDSGRLAPANRQTVGDYLDRWLNGIARPSVDANTADGYEHSIRKHIVPRIGIVKLEAVGPKHVESLLADMVNDKVGARTRQFAFIVLSAALRHAARVGHIHANPCASLDRPRYEPDDVDPFSVADIAALLAVARGKPTYPIFQVAFSCGLRQGELFGLERRDFDPIKATLRIERQLVESKGGLIFKAPKTKAGYRTLHLTAATAEALDAHLSQKRKSSEWDRMMFLTRTSSLIRRSNFGDRHWSRLLQSCDLAHRGMHQARHTYATLMLSAMVPLHVVSRLLGHGDTSITHRIYARFVPEHGESARDAGQAIFG